MLLGSLKSSSGLQKELQLLGLLLRRLPRLYMIDCCPSSSASSGKEGSASSGSEGSIPRLPVQPLNQVLEKYIKSIKPFVNNTELEQTELTVRHFREDEQSGIKLQDLLETRAKNTDNWLTDWWVQTAYLEFRKPLIVYSSPALVYPKIRFANVKEQLQFAAKLISAALEFNKMVEEKKIPQEKLGGSNLCMSQYPKIFGTCRIPKRNKDEILFQDPQNLSRNIIVMFNNHVFSLEAFKENTRDPLIPAQFYATLLEVVLEGKGCPAHPVGILTTENRDDWAMTYELLKQSCENKQILEEYIEKALFVVCIDNPLTLGGGLDYNSRCSKLLMHGFGGKGNAGNRWYDKTIQFIIGAEEDGVGIAYEHTPAEGGPIGVMTNFVMDKIYDKKPLEPSTSFPKPKKLEFEVSDYVSIDIQAAAEAVDKINEDLDVIGYSFLDFGKEAIKGFHLSPDSFIQVAIQLAYYKLHNRIGAQYESGSLRKFLYGRTDTIRTVSTEVVKFCETMTCGTTTREEKESALRAAVAAHKDYTQDVVDGKGVDRHLLGLKILAEILCMEEPKIFSDVAFKRSTYFQLSTSNVPTKMDGFMVYGPLVDDGYACCYNPRKMSINFGLTAWAYCKETRLNSFKHALGEALHDMKNCLTVSSKL